MTSTEPTLGLSSKAIAPLEEVAGGTPVRTQEGIKQSGMAQVYSYILFQHLLVPAVRPTTPPSPSPLGLLVEVTVRVIGRAARFDDCCDSAWAAHFRVHGRSVDSLALGATR